MQDDRKPGPIRSHTVPDPRPSPGPDAELDPEDVDRSGSAYPQSPPPVEYSDDVVAKMPSWRRWVTLFVVCLMALPVTFISTSITTVNPEIARTFNTQPTTISTANAGVLCAMSLSALIWLPITTLIGRRSAYLAASAVIALCALGCALSNNITTFTVMWVLSGTTGPFFLVAGQTVLSDIFEPTVRGTAVGFFLGSTVSAQSITPMISSIIATFTTWRVIFGVLGGVCVSGLLLSYFFVPRARDLPNYHENEKKTKQTIKDVIDAFNPIHVFRMLKYPSIILAHVTCGLLALNQFSLLSSIRHVVNPLFNLTSPLYSGLFFLAPGAGFLAGSVVGGSLSDRSVRKHIVKRGGLRYAEDRLRSSLPWFFIVLPAGTLLYGWSADREVGGMGLPISAAFIQGFGLMAAFNALNTYAAEVYPEFKAAAISAKYMVQFIFSAAGVGGSVPMIDAIGVGWSFTVYAFGVLIAGCIVLFITRCLVRETVATPYPRWHDRKSEASLPT